MGIWQKQLGKMVEHRNQSQPNPTQVYEHMGRPVETEFGNFGPVHSTLSIDFKYRVTISGVRYTFLC